MYSLEKELSLNDGAWKPLSLLRERGVTKLEARTFALVLDSRSIPCCIELRSDNWIILVPEHQLESAEREIALYEEANQSWPPAVPPTRQLVENSLPTISILLLLAIFHNLTVIGISIPGKGLLDLNNLGTAYSLEIIDGKWWQCITALTLHADMVHLLSNLMIGGVFIILLCRELGSGVAWILLLASGAFGNFVNAWVQSPDHRSVGASTAVFAAVGILAAINSLRYRNDLKRVWFVPIAAGLGLLALLGTEGKSTDLGAHFFGFGFGVIFGITAESLMIKFGRPGAILNLFLAFLTAALVLTAWWAAVNFS